KLFREYVHLSDRVTTDALKSFEGTTDPVRLCHLISGHLLVNTSEKQELLESVDSASQFEILKELLVREVEILRIEEKLDHQIRFQMETGRRQVYLEEQLKAINKELGSSPESEWGELEQTIRDTPLPDHARDRVQKEFERLSKLNPIAPEASVIRTYLDWILALPWQGESADNLDVGHAANILEAEHYGLTEVKERILDHIAVLSLVGHLRGPILCLVGPPGVGKTSLGRSIARCLDREFVRVSLGGIRDEAEIRGHRRTYVGALPGRVIQGMRKSGTRNPVFLLDELDKLARDFHGDPGAALLEVLDPEQNRSFTDHYLELEFDLSNVLFLATANTLGEIPGPLRDRMEVIRLPGYLDTEKKTIARQFLWPKQTISHGLGDLAPEITDEAVHGIIQGYTREAGVRELERRLSRVARKLARQVGTGTEALSVVGTEHLKDLLGPPLHLREAREHDVDRAGIACGLAWTAAGGEVLDVEVAVVPGSGKIQLTGTLGEVMKESAFAAVTYARSRARWLGLKSTFHQDLDIHIHIPEGATPKDGPSAGITIAVALISALTDTPTRSDVAMTGEITLRGRVLAVGGLKEKAVAALRSGMRAVLLPASIAPEIELLPEEVRDGLQLVPVETMDQVLTEALVRAPVREPKSDDRPAGTAELGMQVS
ncbi:MAG: endopeptidase La, partial [Longimicrobiales bacterium]